MAGDASGERRVISGEWERREGKWVKSSGQVSGKDISGIFVCITHVVKATYIITLPLRFIPHVLIF